MINKEETIEQYIKRQFAEHKLYAESFIKLTRKFSFNEKYLNPKTGRKITHNAVLKLIEDDINNRTESIVKKIKTK